MEPFLNNEPAALLVSAAVHRRQMLDHIPTLAGFLLLVDRPAAFGPNVLEIASLQ